MNQSKLQILATAAEPGRLDRVLAAAFPQYSRSRFQNLIAEGMVTVEGAAVKDANRRLKGGEQLHVRIPPAASPKPRAEAIPLIIMHEDNDLIVIDKPAGLVVHPGAGHQTGTLVNALIAHCGDSLSGIGGVKRPGIVHRLDKDTSGLLVVAKTDAAHRGLSEQFAAHGRDGRLDRAYLALVWGTPDRSRGVISTGLGRSSANRQKMSVSRSVSARQAVTRYQVVQSFGRASAVSLLRCELETGRTHQIRVHFAHIGHPLLGDKTYGAGFKKSIEALPEPVRDSLIRLNRQALHAAVLGFEHPVTGKKLVFESAPPKDLAELIGTLSRHM